MKQIIISIFFVILLSESSFPQQSVEKYGIYEISFEARISGNPFKDVQLKAIFEHGDVSKEVTGFYDGDGKFIIRFMPHLEGTWFYRTKSNLTSLSDKTGSFECIQSSEKNHGPVSISNTYHFKYSDGTPFYPFGTTCYAWIHQPKEVQEKTLASLKASPFNKIRMCVFPKWYEHSNPLVTHLSIQGDPWENGGVGEGEQKIDRWKMKYDKPVIIDEMKYEGNIRFSFGDLTAKEMTDRFWYTYTKGAYATHGETYIDDHDIIWWAKGGALKGQSPERIKFLRKVVENTPPGGLQRYPDMEEDGNAVSVSDKFILFYFGARQPAERVLIFPELKKYKLEIIDTWEMTITPIEGFFSGKVLVKLPGKPYIAVRAILVQ